MSLSQSEWERRARRSLTASRARREAAELSRPLRSRERRSAALAALVVLIGFAALATAFILIANQ
jgi:hypothetical protein